MNQAFNIKGIEFTINNFKAFIIICLLCFGVYGNTIPDDYNIDDPTVITRNDYVKEGIAGIPDILTHRYQKAYDRASDYRPLAEITYSVEYQFFGVSPHVSHFINILLYMLLAGLLYLLLIRFKLNDPYPYLPLLITCFYIVHTAHTEVVASLKNREEILALLFGICSLLFVHRFYTDSKHRYLNLLGAIVSLLLSLISKITAAPFMGVIILMAYQFGPRLPYRRSLWLAMVAFIVGVILGAIGVHGLIAFAGVPLVIMYVYRDIKGVNFSILLLYLILVSALIFLDIHHSFGTREAHYLENPFINNHDPLTNLVFSLDTLWFYFRFMFFPFPSRYYYGMGNITLHSFSDGVIVLSVLLHTGLFLYGCYALWKRRIEGFFILSYFLCIAAYSNLLAKYVGIVSERALFVPSVWFISALFVMVFNLFKKKDRKKVLINVPGYVWMILAGLFFFYSFLSIQRNFQWKDEITLTTADIRNSPNSPLMNLHYADLLRFTGQAERNDTLREMYLAKSIDYFNRTIKLWPTYGYAWYGLGEIYRYDEGKIDSGCNYFNTGYLCDTNVTYIKFQVARCKYEKGEAPEANRMLAGLFSLMPQDTFVVFYYAKTLFVTGHQDNAELINKQLLNICPTAPYYYINEGFFNNQSGNTNAAVADFEKAVDHGCRDNDILNFLLNYYLSTGQGDKSNLMQEYLSRRR